MTKRKRLEGVPVHGELYTEWVELRKLLDEHGPGALQAEIRKSTERIQIIIEILHEEGKR
ncbi:MAG: hypothetical protein WCH07_04420 [Deltaproteobacteria bacterium]